MIQNMDIAAEILGVVFLFFLGYHAWREHEHTKHIMSMERRLQGTQVLGPQFAEEAEEKPRQGENNVAASKVPLELANHMPSVLDKMQKEGVRFGPNGPIDKA